MKITKISEFENFMNHIFLLIFNLVASIHRDFDHLAYQTRFLKNSNFRTNQFSHFFQTHYNNIIHFILMHNSLPKRFCAQLSSTWSVRNWPRRFKWSLQREVKYKNRIFQLKNNRSLKAYAPFFILPVRISCCTYQ